MPTFLELKVIFLLSLGGLSNQEEFISSRNVQRDNYGDNFKFIALPQQQTQNKINYQEQFVFGQQQQQVQQQQLPPQLSKQVQYDDSGNSKQYPMQIVKYQMPVPYYQQQQQQQQQHYLVPIQQSQQLQQQQQQQQPQGQNVYQFQMLANTNQHHNGNLNPNRNQIQIQKQLYSQVPSITNNNDGNLSQASQQLQQQQQEQQQQRYYQPFSHSGATTGSTKSQQQQYQQQEQHKQQQQQQQQQYSQFNQQQIQRDPPKFEHIQASTGHQPTSSEMSVAFIRSGLPQQQQQHYLQQQSQQQRQPEQKYHQQHQLSLQKQSQQTITKPAILTDDNKPSELLPSYFFNSADERPSASTIAPNAACTRCCKLNQNPCLECCSEDPFLTALTLKVLAG